MRRVRDPRLVLEDEALERIAALGGDERVEALLARLPADQAAAVRAPRDRGAAIPLVRDERERVAMPPVATWTTTERQAVEISLPPGWSLARESLTPNLTDPKEVFSAASFPVRYVEGACVVLGNDASPTTRAQAFAPLDRLRLASG